MPVTKLVDYRVDVRVLSGALVRERGFRVSPVGNYAFISYREPRRGGETVVSGPIPNQGAVIRIRKTPELRVYGEFVYCSGDCVAPEIKRELVSEIDRFLNDGYVAKTKANEGYKEMVEIPLGRRFVTVRPDSERKRPRFGIFDGKSIRVGRSNGRLVNHKVTSLKN